MCRGETTQLVNSRPLGNRTAVTSGRRLAIRSVAFTRASVGRGWITSSVVSVDSVARHTMQATDHPQSHYTPLTNGRRQAQMHYVIYVNSLLYASEAHPAGLESLNFHAEAVAMCLGLATLTVLKYIHSYSSIRILTNCQSLITTLSRGPARQPDSVCISIWSHLSSSVKLPVSTGSGFHLTLAFLATH